MSRTLRLILVATLFVIALIGAALIVALLVLDDDNYRDITRLLVDEALGWTLEVEGTLSVQPGLALTVTGQEAVLTRGETRLAAARPTTFTLELPSTCCATGSPSVISRAPTRSSGSRTSARPPNPSNDQAAGSSSIVAGNMIDDSSHCGDPDSFRPG